VDLDTAGAAASAAAVEFDFDEATSGVDRWWKLLLAKNASGQYQAVFAGIDPTQGNVTVNIDNTSFHTYRVTVKGSTGTLYVDGINKGTMNNFTVVATNSLRMGDLTTNADGEVAVDYVRMNDTGAIPAPEPMALSVLGMGGLLMLRRRGTGG
jgi:hypothetical protein